MFTCLLTIELLGNFENGFLPIEGSICKRFQILATAQYSMNIDVVQSYVLDKKVSNLAIQNLSLR